MSALVERAESFEAAGQLDEALATWRAVLAREGDDAVIRARIAALEERVRRLPGRDDLEAALRERPTDEIYPVDESEPSDPSFVSVEVDTADTVPVVPPAARAPDEPAPRMPSDLEMVGWDDRRAEPAAKKSLLSRFQKKG